MEYQDFLRRPLALGDYVVFPGAYGGGMKLGKIVKFTPKNIKVEHPGYSYYEKKVITRTTLRAADQTVRVEGPDLTFFLLSRENQR